jgi:hypothetical protein
MFFRAPSKNKEIAVNPMEMKKKTPMSSGVLLLKKNATRGIAPKNIKAIKVANPFFQGLPWSPSKQIPSKLF